MRLIKIKTTVLIFLLIGACGSDDCNNSEGCSDTSEKTTDSAEEKNNSDEKTTDQKVYWELADLKQSKLSCEIEEWTPERGNEYNYVRYCQCKIEVVSLRWHHEEWQRHNYLINRGLEDSGILEQCDLYAEKQQSEIPEVTEEVIEEIDDAIEEEEKKKNNNE